jgi:hypothetical protein
LQDINARQPSLAGVSFLVQSGNWTGRFPVQFPDPKIFGRLGPEIHNPYRDSPGTEKFSGISGQ